MPRLLHSLHNRLTCGSEVAILTSRHPFTPRKIPGTELKNPMTSSEIEPAAFAAKCLDVPVLSYHSEKMCIMTPVS
jgi:hypothetical protein